MNGIIVKDEVKIEDLIYEVRGVQVMLDSDLAKLYECKNGTKTINLAVKRHINRFPERFMFRLTRDEYYKILRFQSETLELEQGKYSKYLPYAFTEQGVAMLATILRTVVAEEVSIRIMDAFVAMKKYISSNLIEQKYINNLVLEDHNKIKKLENTFKKFEEKRK
ncbi:MAG: ORF6N domain-containing protein, partial [Bacilli bacterium]|nr:ORF6N domain-containing protein [Bacilli bacterium]